MGGGQAAEGRGGEEEGGVEHVAARSDGWSGGGVMCVSGRSTASAYV